MRKILLILIIFIVIPFFFISKVYASCSTPSLYVKNTDSDFTYSPDSPIVINGVLYSPGRQTDLIRASATSSGCSGAPQYNFIIRYWNQEGGGYWSTIEESGFSTSGSVYLGLDAGVRQYLVGVWAWPDLSPERYYYYYGMTKTASSANVSSSTASLSWSERMNHYTGISCSAANDVSFCPTRVQFYLLMGKSSSILTDRTTAAGEIGPIEGFQQDYDPTTQRITYAIDNLGISNLDPGSTYYWRIRAVHPNGTNSFFSGGSFITTAAAPQDLPTPSAGEVLDQSQTGPLTLQWPISSAIYQTFTAGVTGNISKVATKVTKASSATGNLLAAVVNAPGGIPGSTLLSDEVSIPASSIASYPDFGVVVFNFTTQPLLTAGQKYAIRIRNSAATYGEFGINSNKNNLYLDGNVYDYQSAAYPCHSNEDYYFGTYMRNATTPSPGTTVPPPSGETFGKTTIGTCGDVEASQQWGTKASLLENGQISTVTAYLKWDGSGSNNVKAVIYADNAGGPGVKKGESQVTTFTTTPSWVTFTFSPNVTLAAGTYWLSILGQEVGVYGYYDYAGTFSSFFTNNVPWSPAMDPASYSANSYNSSSVYATYTPTIAAVTPPTTTSCGGGANPRAEGLVSTPNIPLNSIFGSSGACVFDAKAAFVPFKIPSFDDLQSLYYTQNTQK